MHAARKTLFLMFVSLALAGGAFLAYLTSHRSNAAPAYATVLPEPLPLPEFSLQDHNGDTFNRESFKGQWSLVFFGFTHCPDICPATLQQLSMARAKQAENSRQPFPQILLISVDPERDTPPVLRQYINHFGAGVGGVTGQLDELKKLTTVLGIFFEKSPPATENYGVDHSAVVLLIDPDAHFHALFSAPHSVDRFVADIPLVTGTD
jgi:protein SCO1/2